MALAIYRNALREFETALSSIRLYLKFIATANHLRPRVTTSIDWDNIQQDQKKLILCFAKQKEYQIQIGFNGLIVSLASEFEKYVRRLVVDGVSWINETLSTYEEAFKAHQTLMHHNITLSAYALATIGKPSTVPAYDYEELCERLGSCRKNGGPLGLNAIAFGSQVSNATVDRIKDALERMCLALDWDRIGDDEHLRKLMDENTSGRTSKAVERWLQEFIKKRNNIAHAGIGGVTMTEEEVEKAIDILKAFGGALAKETEALLEKKHKTREKG